MNPHAFRPLSNGAMPFSLAAILAVVLLAGGCGAGDAPAESEDEGGEDGAPRFLAQPQLVLAPDPATPLAARLRVNTDTQTRVTVDIDDGSRQWRVRFDGYGTQHQLPVLGLRPGTEHTLTVRAITPAGDGTTLDTPLTLNTEPLPAGFPDITVESRTASQMEPGFTLFDTLPQADGQAPFLVIADDEGEVVWFHQGPPRYMDPRQLANGNLLMLLNNYVVEMDLLGNRVRQWLRVDDAAENPDAIATAAFHHEAFPMENGNLLVLSVEERSFDNYPADASDLSQTEPTAQVAGDIILELSPEGEVINQWKLLDMLDPYRIGYDFDYNFWQSTFGHETRDWSHANAVIHDPSDDSIIVSLRHQDAVIKFSRETGELIWILGPHDNWNPPFSDKLLQPLNPDGFFFPFHQHAPQVLPNGNLLVYDNGNYRASPPSQPMAGAWFSRAVEYKIDAIDHTVERVWQYGQPGAGTAYYAGALGDADHLPQTGNVLITHGNLVDGQDEHSARLIEVTRGDSATEVFHLRIASDDGQPGNGWRVYRSERIPSLYPPGITVSELP